MDLSEIILITEYLSGNLMTTKIKGITVELSEKEAVLLRFSIQEYVPNVEVNEARPYTITHAGIVVTIITKK